MGRSTLLQVGGQTQTSVDVIGGQKYSILCSTDRCGLRTVSARVKNVPGTSIESRKLNSRSVCRTLGYSGFYFLITWSLQSWNKAGIWHLARMYTVQYPPFGSVLDSNGTLETIGVRLQTPLLCEEIKKKKKFPYSPWSRTWYEYLAKLVIEARMWRESSSEMRVKKFSCSSAPTDLTFNIR